MLNISAKSPKFGGIFNTFFRAPSEQRKRRRRKKQKARILSFGNSSSSSVNSDMAYGRGYIDRDKSQLTSPRPQGYASPSLYRAEPTDAHQQQPRPPMPRDKTDEEILEIGRQLQDIARRQNEHDLKSASKSRASQLAGTAAGAAAAAAAFSHFHSKSKSDTKTRGSGTSKPNENASSSDDDWESASEDEATTTDDSDNGLAYGSSIKPSKSARISTEPPEQIKPPSRRSTIVDPRLFGPVNSLRGAVKSPCGFGEEDPRSAGSSRRHHEETVAQVESPKTGKQPMQRIYPVPTSDPDKFDYDRSSVTSSRQDVPQRARPDPVPIQQPIPIVPLPPKVYDAERFEEEEERRNSKQPRQPPKGRSAAENAIAGVGIAAAAIGATMAAKRRDSGEYIERRDDRRSEVRDYHRDDFRDSWQSRRIEEEPERLVRIELEDRDPRDQNDPRRPHQRNNVEIVDDRDKRRSGRSDPAYEALKKPDVETDPRPEVYKLPQGDEIRVEYDPKDDRRPREEPKEPRRDDRKPVVVVDERRDAKRVEKPTEAPREKHGVEHPEAPNAQAPIDPFQFQVADDAFQTPKYATPKRPLTPQVVTVDREPNFDDSPPRKPDYSESRMSRKDSFELEKRLEQYQQGARDRSRTPEPRRRRDSLQEEQHAAKSIYDEAKHATVPIAAAAIASAIAVEEERSRKHRNDHVTEDGSRDRSRATKDAVQEEADRYYRETVIARKIAKDEIRSRSASPHDESVVGKWQDHDEGPDIVTIVTPPEMDHPHDKSPYDAPNADVRIDHVIIPDELSRFRLPHRQLDPGAQPIFQSRDPSAERERPLLNLVLPTPVVTPRHTPAPEKQAEEQPSSRSQEPLQTRSVTSAEPPSSATTPATEIVFGPRGEVVERPTTPTAKSVTWGENETKSFQIESPEPPIKEPSATSSKSKKKKKKLGKSSPWGIIAAGVAGGAAAAAVSEAPKMRDPFESKPEEDRERHSPPESPKSRSVEPISPIIEAAPSKLTTSFEDDADLPPAPGPKPSSPQTSRMPGAFADDLEFASVLAAGLQDTGFDPNIVIDNPTYMRRDSPPGQSEPAVYQQPFAETVTDLGIYGSDHVHDGPTAGDRGFVIGEVPETPVAEKEMHNGHATDSPRAEARRDKGKAKEMPFNEQEPLVEEAEPPRKLSKKEKRKQKASKRQSLDNALPEETYDAPESRSQPGSAPSSVPAPIYERPRGYYDVPEATSRPEPNPFAPMDHAYARPHSYHDVAEPAPQPAPASYSQAMPTYDRPHSYYGEPTVAYRDHPAPYAETGPSYERPSSYYDTPQSPETVVALGPKTRGFQDAPTWDLPTSSATTHPRDETPVSRAVEPEAAPTDPEASTSTKTSKKDKKKKSRSSRSDIIVTYDDDEPETQEPSSYNEPSTSREKLPERDSYRSDEPREAGDDAWDEPAKKKKSKKSKQSSDEWTDVEKQSDYTATPTVERSSTRDDLEEWDDLPPKSQRDRSKFEERDVSSVVSDPSSRRDKSEPRSKSSRIDDRDVSSVVSDPASRRDKSDRRSRSSRYEDADTSSVVSDPSSRREKSDRRSRSSRFDDRDASSVVSDPATRSEKSERRSKSRREDDRDAASVVSDRSSRREKSDRHSNGTRYDDDAKSVVSESSERKRRSRDDKKSPKEDEKRSSGFFNNLFGNRSSKDVSSKDEKSSFLDNAGTLGAGAGLASAVAALGSMMSRSNATEPQLEESSDAPRDRERSASPPRDLEIVDPEIVPRTIRPAIDPQYGDFLPLPPSPMPPSTPGSPTQADLDELPALPDSRPETPPEERRRQHETKTPKTHARKRSNMETPTRSPSQTAVPFKLRLGQRSAPSSPGTFGVSPVTSPAVPTFPETTHITPPHPASLSRRPSRPISWENSREIKPLYLLEQARQESAAQSMEPPIDFPELPPSEPSSRESPAPEFTLRDEDVNYFHQLQASPFEPDLRLDTDLSRYPEHTTRRFSSQETTPKAEYAIQHAGAMFDAASPRLPASADTARGLDLSEHELEKLPALPASPMTSPATAIASPTHRSNIPESKLEQLPALPDSPVTHATEMPEPEQVETTSKERSSYLLHMTPPSIIKNLMDRDTSDTPSSPTLNRSRDIAANLAEVDHDGHSRDDAIGALLGGAAAGLGAAYLADRLKSHDKSAEIGRDVKTLGAPEPAEPPMVEGKKSKKDKKKKKKGKSASVDGFTLPPDEPTSSALTPDADEALVSAEPLAIDSIDKDFLPSIDQARTMPIEEPAHASTSDTVDAAPVDRSVEPSAAIPSVTVSSNDETSLNLLPPLPAASADEHTLLSPDFDPSIHRAGDALLSTQDTRSVEPIVQAPHAVEDLPAVLDSSDHAGKSVAEEDVPVDRSALVEDIAPETLTFEPLLEDDVSEKKLSKKERKKQLKIKKAWEQAQAEMQELERPAESTEQNSKAASEADTTPLPALAPVFEQTAETTEAERAAGIPLPEVLDKVFEAPLESLADVEPTPKLEVAIETEAPSTFLPAVEQAAAIPLPDASDESFDSPLDSLASIEHKPDTVLDVAALPTSLPILEQVAETREIEQTTAKPLSEKVEDMSQSNTKEVSEEPVKVEEQAKAEEVPKSEEDPFAGLSKKQKKKKTAAMAAATAAAAAAASAAAIVTNETDSFEAKEPPVSSGPLPEAVSEPPIDAEKATETTTESETAAGVPLPEISGPVSETSRETREALEPVNAPKEQESSDVELATAVPLPEHIDESLEPEVEQAQPEQQTVVEVDPFAGLSNKQKKKKKAEMKAAAEAAAVAAATVSPPEHVNESLDPEASVEPVDAPKEKESSNAELAAAIPLPEQVDELLELEVKEVKPEEQQEHVNELLNPEFKQADPEEQPEVEVDPFAGLSNKQKKKKKAEMKAAAEAAEAAAATAATDVAEATAIDAAAVPLPEHVNESLELEAEHPKPEELPEVEDKPVAEDKPVVEKKPVAEENSAIEEMPMDEVDPFAGLSNKQKKKKKAEMKAAAEAAEAAATIAASEVAAAVVPLPDEHVNESLELEAERPKPEEQPEIEEKPVVEEMRMVDLDPFAGLSNKQKKMKKAEMKAAADAAEAAGIAASAAAEPAKVSREVEVEQPAAASPAQPIEESDPVTEATATPETNISQTKEPIELEEPATTSLADTEEEKPETEPEQLKVEEDPLAGLSKKQRKKKLVEMAAAAEAAAQATAAEAIEIPEASEVPPEPSLAPSADVHEAKDMDEGEKQPATPVTEEPVPVPVLDPAQEPLPEVNNSKEEVEADLPASPAFPEASTSDTKKGKKKKKKKGKESLDATNEPLLSTSAPEPSAISSQQDAPKLDIGAMPLGTADDAAPVQQESVSEAPETKSGQIQQSLHDQQLDIGDPQGKLDTPSESLPYLSESKDKSLSPADSLAEQQIATVDQDKKPADTNVAVIDETQPVLLAQEESPATLEDDPWQLDEDPWQQQPSASGQDDILASTSTEVSLPPAADQIIDDTSVESREAEDLARAESAPLSKKQKKKQKKSKKDQTTEALVESEAKPSSLEMAASTQPSVAEVDLVPTDNDTSQAVPAEPAADNATIETPIAKASEERSVLPDTEPDATTIPLPGDDADFVEQTPQQLIAEADAAGVPLPEDTAEKTEVSDPAPAEKDTAAIPLPEDVSERASILAPETSDNVPAVVDNTMATSEPSLMEPPPAEPIQAESSGKKKKKKKKGKGASLSQLDDVMSSESTPLQSPGVQTPTTEAPINRAPVNETAATDVLVGEGPVIDTPAFDAWGIESPAPEYFVNAPTTEAPSVEAPSVETPSVEIPAVETSIKTPAAETPVAETPEVETSTAAAEVPVSKVSTTDALAGDPSSEKTVTDTDASEPIPANAQHPEDADLQTAKPDVLAETAPTMADILETSTSSLPSSEQQQDSAPAEETSKSSKKSKKQKKKDKKAAEENDHVPAVINEELPAELADISSSNPPIDEKSSATDVQKAGQSQEIDAKSTDFAVEETTQVEPQTPTMSESQDEAFLTPLQGPATPISPDEVFENASQEPTLVDSQRDSLESKPQELIVEDQQDRGLESPVEPEAPSSKKSKKKAKKAAAAAAAAVAAATTLEPAVEDATKDSDKMDTKDETVTDESITDKTVTDIGNSNTTISDKIGEMEQSSQEPTASGEFATDSKVSEEADPGPTVTKKGKKKKKGKKSSTLDPESTLENPADVANTREQSAYLTSPSGEPSSDEIPFPQADTSTEAEWPTATTAGKKKRKSVTWAPELESFSTIVEPEPEPEMPHEDDNGLVTASNTESDSISEASSAVEPSPVQDASRAGELPEAGSPGDVPTSQGLDEDLDQQTATVVAEKDLDSDGQAQMHPAGEPSEEALPTLQDTTATPSDDVPSSPGLNRTTRGVAGEPMDILAREPSTPAFSSEGGAEVANEKGGETLEREHEVDAEQVASTQAGATSDPEAAGRPDTIDEPSAGSNAQTGEVGSQDPGLHAGVEPIDDKSLENTQNRRIADAQAVGPALTDSALELLEAGDPLQPPVTALANQDTNTAIPQPLGRGTQDRQVPSQTSLEVGKKSDAGITDFTAETETLPEDVQQLDKISDVEKKEEEKKDQREEFDSLAANVGFPGQSDLSESLGQPILPEPQLEPLSETLPGLEPTGDPNTTHDPEQTETQVGQGDDVGSEPSSSSKMSKKEKKSSKKKTKAATSEPIPQDDVQTLKSQIVDDGAPAVKAVDEPVQAPEQAGPDPSPDVTDAPEAATVREAIEAGEDEWAIQPAGKKSKKDKKKKAAAQASAAVEELSTEPTPASEKCEVPAEPEVPLQASADETYKGVDAGHHKSTEESADTPENAEPKQSEEAQAPAESISDEVQSSLQPTTKDELPAELAEADINDFEPVNKSKKDKKKKKKKQQSLSLDDSQELAQPETPLEESSSASPGDALSLGDATQMPSEDVHASSEPAPDSPSQADAQDDLTLKSEKAPPAQDSPATSRPTDLEAGASSAPTTEESEVKQELPSEPSSQTDPSPATLETPADNTIPLAEEEFPAVTKKSKKDKKKKKGLASDIPDEPPATPESQLVAKEIDLSDAPQSSEMSTASAMTPATEQPSSQAVDEEAIPPETAVNTESSAIVSEDPISENQTPTTVEEELTTSKKSKKDKKKSKKDIAQDILEDSPAPEAETTPESIPTSQVEEAREEAVVPGDEVFAQLRDTAEEPITELPEQQTEVSAKAEPEQEKGIEETASLESEQPKVEDDPFKGMSNKQKKKKKAEMAAAATALAVATEAAAQEPTPAAEDQTVDSTPATLETSPEAQPTEETATEEPSAPEPQTADEVKSAPQVTPESTKSEEDPFKGMDKKQKKKKMAEMKAAAEAAEAVEVEKPTEDDAAVEKPVEAHPTEDLVAEKTSIEEELTGKQPADEKSAHEIPIETHSTDDMSKPETTTEDKTPVEEMTSDKTTIDPPVEEQSAVEPERAAEPEVSEAVSEPVKEEEDPFKGMNKKQKKKKMAEMAAATKAAEAAAASEAVSEAQKVSSEPATTEEETPAPAKLVDEEPVIEESAAKETAAESKSVPEPELEQPQVEEDPFAGLSKKEKKKKLAAMAAAEAEDKAIEQTVGEDKVADEMPADVAVEETPAAALPAEESTLADRPTDEKAVEDAPVQEPPRDDVQDKEDPFKGMNKKQKKKKMAEMAAAAELAGATTVSEPATTETSQVPEEKPEEVAVEHKIIEETPAGERPIDKSEPEPAVVEEDPFKGMNKKQKKKKMAEMAAAATAAAATAGFIASEVKDVHHDKATEDKTDISPEQPPASEVETAATPEEAPRDVSPELLEVKEASENAESQFDAPAIPETNANDEFPMVEKKAKKDKKKKGKALEILESGPSTEVTAQASEPAAEPSIETFAETVPELPLGDPTPAAEGTVAAVEEPSSSMPSITIDQSADQSMHLESPKAPMEEPDKEVIEAVATGEPHLDADVAAAAQESSKSMEEDFSPKLSKKDKKKKKKGKLQDDSSPPSGTTTPTVFEPSDPLDVSAPDVREEAPAAATTDVPAPDSTESTRETSVDISEPQAEAVTADVRETAKVESELPSVASEAEEVHLANAELPTNDTDATPAPVGDSSAEVSAVAPVETPVEASAEIPNIDDEFPASQKKSKKDKKKRKGKIQDDMEITSGAATPAEALEAENQQMQLPDVSVESVKTPTHANFPKAEPISTPIQEVEDHSVAETLASAPSAEPETAVDQDSIAKESQLPIDAPLEEEWPENAPVKKSKKDKKKKKSMAEEDFVLAYGNETPMETTVEDNKEEVAHIDDATTTDRFLASDNKTASEIPLADALVEAPLEVDSAQASAQEVAQLSSSQDVSQEQLVSDLQQPSPALLAENQPKPSASSRNIELEPEKTAEETAAAEEPSEFTVKKSKKDKKKRKSILTEPETPAPSAEEQAVTLETIATDSVEDPSTAEPILESSAVEPMEETALSTEESASVIPETEPAGVHSQDAQPRQVAESDVPTTTPDLEPKPKGLDSQSDAAPSTEQESIAPIAAESLLESASDQARSVESSNVVAEPEAAAPADLDDLMPAKKSKKDKKKKKRQSLAFDDVEPESPLASGTATPKLESTEQQETERALNQQPLLVEDISRHEDHTSSNEPSFTRDILATDKSLDSTSVPQSLPNLDASAGPQMVDVMVPERHEDFTQAQAIPDGALAAEPTTQQVVGDETVSADRVDGVLPGASMDVTEQDDTRPVEATSAPDVRESALTEEAEETFVVKKSKKDKKKRTSQVQFEEPATPILETTKASEQAAFAEPGPEVVPREIVQEPVVFDDVPQEPIAEEFDSKKSKKDKKKAKRLSFADEPETIVEEQTSAPVLPEGDFTAPEMSKSLPDTATGTDVAKSSISLTDPGHQTTAMLEPESTTQPVFADDDEWDIPITKRSKKNKKGKKQSISLDRSPISANLLPEQEMIVPGPSRTEDTKDTVEYFDSAPREITRSPSAPPPPETASALESPAGVVPEPTGVNASSPTSNKSVDIDLTPAQETSNVVHELPFDQPNKRKKMKTRELSDTLLPEPIVSSRDVAAAYFDDRETPAAEISKIGDELPTPEADLPREKEIPGPSAGKDEPLREPEPAASLDIAASYMEHKYDHKPEESIQPITPEKKAPESSGIGAAVGAAALAAGAAALASKSSSGKKKKGKKSKYEDKRAAQEEDMFDDPSLWEGADRKHVSEIASKEVEDFWGGGEETTDNQLPEQSTRTSMMVDDVFGPSLQQQEGVPIQAQDTIVHGQEPSASPVARGLVEDVSKGGSQEEEKAKDVLSLTAPLKEKAQDDNIESPILGREIGTDQPSEPANITTQQRSVSRGTRSPMTNTMVSDMDEAVDRGFEAEARRDLFVRRSPNSPERTFEMSGFRSPVPSILPPVQEEGHDGSDIEPRLLYRPASRTTTGSPDPTRDSGFVPSSPHPLRRGGFDNEEQRDSGVHLRDWQEQRSPGRDGQRTPELRVHRSERRRSRELERAKSPEKTSLIEGEARDHPLSRTPVLREPAGRELTPEPQKHKRGISPELERRRNKYQDLASAALAGAAISSTVSSPRSTPPPGNRSVSDRVARLQSPAPTEPIARRSMSNSSLSRHRRATGALTPEPLKFRPESPGIQRSGTATPPLRRVDRRVSGDLRSISQRSQLDLNKDPKDPTSSSNTPVANEGRVRTKDMADVFVSNAHFLFNISLYLLYCLTACDSQAVFVFAASACDSIASHRHNEL